MKKCFLVVLLSVLIFSGCNKKEVVNNEINFNIDTYKIYEPYKESISGNYINYMVNNKYDVDNIQSRLMDLSNKYFKTSSYYYQAGQYLDINKIKDILNIVNSDEKINIDGIDISPKYLTYVHEQNYLDKEGNLKGISIGLALSKYQSYKNIYGATLYKEIDEEEVINHVKDKIPSILNYLREVKGLENIRIVLGLYISSSPNSLLPGEYKYIGITSDNSISFNSLEYSYYYLDSNSLMKKNIDIYKAFKNFQEHININNIYISGYGLFYENKLVNASINIISSYLNKDELIYLEQLVSNALNNSFTLETSVTVYIKINNEIVGMVIKNDDNKIINYILE